ncbi:MAG: hypothetical protein FJY85_09330 [Deltaproteobacteria bacterium]|nr:hypothetical protein [Deltaproteobacteria bacterium]
MGRGIELVCEHADPLPPVHADAHLTKLILVQGLTFARDSVEATAQWHEQRRLPYRKSVSVKLIPANGGSAAMIAWNAGQVPENPPVLDHAVNLGLVAAESILVSIEGKLITSPNSVLLQIP